MKVYEIGTGYTPIPANMGAATEIVVEELTKSMRKKKIEVSIVDIKTKDRLPNDLPIIEVSVPSKFTDTDVQLGLMHKLKRVIYSINLAFILKKILKAENDKVVFHFHNQYNMFFFLKLTSKKIRKKAILAYTVHSYVWDAKWEDIKKIAHKRYFQEIECMKKADLIYVLNDRSAKIFTKELGVNPKKIRLINNGVNTELYYPLEKDIIEKSKIKYNLTGCKVFLQVGSVCDRKNQKGAIELLKDYMQLNKNAYFVYVGGVIDKEYQNEINQIAKEYGIENQVRYLGEISPGTKLNEIYNLADATIFPSKNEAFGLVIIEAMSAGIPTITCGNLCLELDNLIQCKDSKKIIDIVNEQIFSEKRKGVSEKSRNEIIDKYSWDKVVTDYLKGWENK